MNVSLGSISDVVFTRLFRINLKNTTRFSAATRSFVPPGWLYNRGSPAGGGSTHTSFHNASAQHNSLHNGSQQLNTSSAAWSTHNASSLNASTNNASAAASFSSPYRNYNKRDIITDEHELQKYLRSDPYGAGASAAAQDDSSADVNALNTLRAYCNSAAHLLKQSLYQISPASVSPGKALSSSAKDDLVSGIFASLSGSDGGGAGGNISATNATLGGGGGGSVFDGVVGAATAGLASASAAAASASEADESYELQRLSANGQLTQSIYNLRGWLAVTIVQRLDAEIEKTNRALGGNTQAEYRGFTDVQIGKVGLERLRKTAEVQPLVAAYVPMLPRIVDFVQVSSNQEYLVQRLHDLARGCVLAEYRWNGGGTYGGVAWDEHLHPTDAQIMFHLFCTYLDGQLPPLPQPGGRPFYTRYVVHGDKRTADEIKAEVRNKSGCAILCTSAPQRPRFNFITTRTIHSSVHVSFWWRGFGGEVFYNMRGGSFLCAQDRNNLFNVIVEFLVYMRTHNEGMLESINLGRSGINLLRVIGD